VRGTGDVWEEVERAVQRGRGRHLTNLLRDGDRRTLLSRPEFTRSGRSIDFSGKIRINLVHLAILERKPAVLALLLGDLDTELLTEVVTEQIVTLDQERILPTKKEEEETKRMFTVAGKRGASISVISCMETVVDWQPTYQWSSIHLAVKHDVECLKVLLSLVEQRLPSDSLASLLGWTDTKGRTALHLAASDPNSSSPTKLLLDCGAEVGPLDSYLVSPLLGAARAGTVDTARELLEHGADSCGPQMDVTGRFPSCLPSTLPQVCPGLRPLS